MLPSVDDLYSVIRICLWPRYVWSLTSLPCVLRVYPTAWMRSVFGVWVYVVGVRWSRVWTGGVPGSLICHLVGLHVESG